LKDRVNANANARSDALKTLEPGASTDTMP
jgi:hypothetical protein